MRNPHEYKTLSGLLRAVERVLRRRGRTVSESWWLSNAEYAAETTFGAGASVRLLREKFTITRRQDLVGGDSVFGMPLPKRDYEVGDNVPGVGRIMGVAMTPHGKQFEIDGQWFSERSL